MSKKVVVILSILAIALSGTALGLWYTVKGKNEQAFNSLGKLPEFGGATFESRLGAPAKAAAELAKVRDDNKAKAEDIAGKETKISGLERNVKDKETNISELETKLSEVTRTRDDAQGKVEVLQTKATTAESKVKELEEKLVAQNEESAKAIEELNRKVDTDKGSLVAETERIRGAYSQLYNFATGRGLQPPTGPRPWEANSGAAGKVDGPSFATNSFVAEIVGLDSRQGFLVLNIGPESGVSRDQGFDLYLRDELIGKISITGVLNGSVSTAVVAKGTSLAKLAVGTPVRLVPFGSVTPAAAPAPAAK